MNVIILNGGSESWGTVFFRSIGPYKIAHWIRKHGYTCQIIDHVDRFNLDQIYKALKKFITNDTYVIGISTTFMSMDCVMHSDGIKRHIPETIYRVLHQIKHEHPRIKFVMGGYVSDRIAGRGWNGLIDATVMSYNTATEDVFLEYLEHLVLEKDPPIGEFRSPNFGGEKRAIYNKAKNPKYNIETDDFRFLKQDVILSNEALPLDVSRGCIFACKFCQFPYIGKKKMDYLRGMEYIRNEIIYNKETFGVTRYFILDDTFNDTEYKMREFLSMTQTLGFKIDYASYLRADLIHRFPDTAYMLQESGLFGAFHGLETLHEDAAKMIGKGWSGKHARNFIPILYHDVWKKKIAQYNSFIVGFPDETPEHVENTANWFIENDLHSILFNRLYIHGTGRYDHLESTSEFDRNAEKYGFEWLEKDLDGNGWKNWKNKNWTTSTAEEMTRRLTEKVDDFTKIPWIMTVPLLGYGFSKEYLMTTKKNDLPMNSVKTITDFNFEKYFQLLMEL